MSAGIFFIVFKLQEKIPASKGDSFKTNLPKMWCAGKENFASIFFGSNSLFHLGQLTLLISNMFET